MIKKCLHIILCIWLINSVSYFHPNNPFGDCEESGCSEQNCSKINTWADDIIHIVSDDEPDSHGHSHHKFSYQRKYVNTRINVLNSFLPQLQFAFSFIIPKQLLFNSSKYTVSVAKLPLYYNFLFRLSPF